MLLCFPKAQHVDSPICDGCNKFIPIDATVYVLAGVRDSHINLCLSCMETIKADFDTFQKKEKKG